MILIPVVYIGAVVDIETVVVVHNNFLIGGVPQVTKARR